MYSDDSDFVVTPKRKKSSPDLHPSPVPGPSRQISLSLPKSKRYGTSRKTGHRPSPVPGHSRQSLSISPISKRYRASRKTGRRPLPVAGPSRQSLLIFPKSKRYGASRKTGPHPSPDAGKLVPENYGSLYASAAAKMLGYVFETHIVHFKTSNFTDICNANPKLKTNFELEDGRVCVEFGFVSRYTCDFVKQLRQEVTGFGPYLWVNIQSGFPILPLIPTRLQGQSISHLEYEIIGFIAKQSYECFVIGKDGKWMSMTTMEPVCWSEMIQHIVLPITSVMFGIKEKYFLEPIEKPDSALTLSESHKQSLIDCFNRKNLRKITSDKRKMPTPKKELRTKLQLRVVELLGMDDSTTQFALNEIQYSALVSAIADLPLQPGPSRLVVHDGVVKRLRNEYTLEELCKVCMLHSKSVKIGLQSYCPIHYPKLSQVVFAVFRYHARVTHNVNGVDLTVIGSETEQLPKAKSFKVGRQLYGAHTNALTAKVDMRHVYFNRSIADANSTLFALRVMNVMDTFVKGKHPCFARTNLWLKTDFFQNFHPPSMQKMCSNFGFEVVIGEAIEPFTLQRSLNACLAFVPEGYWCSMPRVYTRVHHLDDETNVIYVGKYAGDDAVAFYKHRYFPGYQFSSVVALTPHPGLLSTIESACQQAYALASLFGIRKYGKKIILNNQCMEVVDHCLESSTHLELIQTIFAQEFGKSIRFKKIN